MKGIVFTELLDLAEKQFGLDVVDRAITESNLPSGGAYTAVGTYDHTEAVAIVMALSRLTGTPVPTLLHAFGEHLFARFVELYPRFFTGVTDTFTFLSRIDDYIHVEVRKLYPDAELPRFHSEQQAANVLRMTYRSPRHMGDLAAGLIAGCGKHFGERLFVARDDSGGPGEIVFSITRAA